MGLHYLREHEIVHGDRKGVCLSPQRPSHAPQDLRYNILGADKTPARACLADFRLSTLVPSVPGEMATTTAGSMPLYVDPELLDPEKFGKTNSRPTQPADMYALGMVMYEVAHRV